MEATIIQAKPAKTANQPKPPYVLNVKTSSDWDLIVATNYYGVKNDLPEEVADRVMRAVWFRQDGYGEPGYVPAQGWDWSGIRDSSAAAVIAMAAAVRELLGREGIETITVTPEW